MHHIHGKSIGVTGGAGFIGSHLVEFLAEQAPSRLVVLDDLSTGSRSNLERVVDKVELIVGDVVATDAGRVVSDLDLVFHLAVRNVRASIREPVENLEVNALGTVRILEAMRRGAGGAFVYVSSSEVYGIPDSGEYHEAVLPKPTTVYGAGKLAGEHVANAFHATYGMNTRVIRPFNNFGPRSHFEGDSGEVIPKFIIRALAGRPLVIHGSGEQTRDFMYVTETARWLAALAGIASLEGQTVNIGSGRGTSIQALAEMILAKADSPSRVTYGPARPGDLPELVANTALVKSHSAFELNLDLHEGIDRTIDFFRDGDIESMLAMEVEQTWT